MYEDASNDRNKIFQQIPITSPINHSRHSPATTMLRAAFRLSSHRAARAILTESSSTSSAGALIFSKSAPLTSTSSSTAVIRSFSTLHDISAVDITSDSRIYAGDVPLPLTTDCTIFEADDVPTGKVRLYGVGRGRRRRNGMQSRVCVNAVGGRRGHDIVNKLPFTNAKLTLK